VLMAAAKLPETCRALIEAGRPADQPACLVQWAATSGQRSVVGTLADLAARATAEGIGAPATLVAGDVVSLADALAWVVEDPSETALGDRAAG
jgi:siroheme synthase